MIIEYKIRFSKDGVTVSQRVDGGDAGIGPGGQRGGEEPIRPGGGDENIGPGGKKGGEEPIRPGGGGEEPIRPGGGGEEPIRPGGGGFSEFGPAIIFGPIIIGLRGLGSRQGAELAEDEALIPSQIPVVDGPQNVHAVKPSKQGWRLPKPVEISKFSMEGQEQTNWCWAAVSSAVQKHSPGNSTSPTAGLRQCDVANEVLRLNDCCSNGEAHNVQASLDAALKTIGKYQWADTCQASFRGIAEEISQGRPVCARIAWDPDGDRVENGAHFVAIYGCFEKDGVPHLKVRDPLLGAPHTPASSLEISYDDFCSRYGLSGTWVATYFVKG